MRLRRVLSLCCVTAIVGGLFAVVPPVQAAPSFTRVVTVSSPLTATGSINPAAFVDVSAAPFNTGGPFTVTGYYRFNKLGEHTGSTPNATVFDVTATDTKGQWKSFTSTFSSASAFTQKGLILWYTAGDLSVGGLVIKNAAGNVVYNLETDTAQTAATFTANTTRGVWYFWNYGPNPDFFSAVTIENHSASTSSGNASRVLTVSSPNTANGSINPAVFVDSSAAPFKIGGPFTVTGQYRFKKVADLNKGTGNTPAATVFDISVSDTKGQWKSFTSSFNTGAGLTPKGLVLWYMAGELSVKDLVIKNGAGLVVYNMNADSALTAAEISSLTTRGIWYFWNYGDYPEFLSSIAVNDTSTGLVDGCGYTLSGKKLSGIPYGTDVGTVRSNFKHNETMTAWRGGKQLADTDLVTKDTTFVYNKGKTGSVTYTVADVVGDVNGDGKLDIRDLRHIKEASFNRQTLSNKAAGDIDGNSTVNATDANYARNAILGKPVYAKQSVGADTLLKMANPVGRLCKDSNRLYMELSACNFTLTGYFKGDVTANIYVEKYFDDQRGIYVEVDGASNMHYIKLTAVNGYQTVKLASGLSEGKHTIRVYKATDARNDVLRISAVKFTGTLLKTPVAERRIEFLGDSITAAACIFDNAKPAQVADYNTYGLTASWHGYAKKTADALGASHYSVAIGGWKLCYSTNPSIAIRSIYPYVSMHAKLSKGEYAFDYNPNVVVINLGTNDWAENQATYQQNALELLKYVRSKNPKATIVWAYGMMDQDHPSVGWIQATVNQFAATDRNTYFIAMSENTNGLWAHPDKAAHIAAGNTLANFIKSKMGW